MTKRVARGQQVNYCNPKIGTEETESLVEMCHVCGVHTSYSHQPSPAQPSPAQPSCYSATGVGGCWRLLCFYSILLCVLPLVFRSTE